MRHLICCLRDSLVFEEHEAMVRDVLLHIDKDSAQPALFKDTFGDMTIGETDEQV